MLLAMPVQRGYRDACGIAHGLELVGERWALLVVRELLLGPKRFTDLRRGLPLASPNALSDRLQELTAAGIIRRRRLEPPAASWVYELTGWGRELEPIVIALGTWALNSPQHDGSGQMSVDSLMLTIRSYFKPDDGRRGAIEVVVEREPRERFGIWLDEDGATVSHVPPESPDAVVRGETMALAEVLGSPAELDRALGVGRIQVEGDDDVLRRLVGGIEFPQHLVPAGPRMSG
jgi:DNA-binding HxlR family transcriptional regulator